MTTLTSLPTATIYRFPHILPVNSFVGGRRRGCYSNDNWRQFNGGSTPLRTTGGAKDLSVVCFNQRFVRPDEYVPMLINVGVIPCRMAPNYLLGLMEQVPERLMPDGLLNKDIIAAEPGNPTSKFFAKQQDKAAFLMVERQDSERKLSFTYADSEWRTWEVFLAEDSAK